MTESEHRRGEARDHTRALELRVARLTQALEPLAAIARAANLSRPPVSDDFTLPVAVGVFRQALAALESGRE